MCPVSIKAKEVAFMRRTEVQSGKKNGITSQSKFAQMLAVFIYLNQKITRELLATANKYKEVRGIICALK